MSSNENFVVARRMAETVEWLPPHIEYTCFETAIKAAERLARDRHYDVAVFDATARTAEPRMRAYYPGMPREWWGKPE